MRLRTFVTAAILLFWAAMMSLHIRHEYLPQDNGASSQPAYARQAFTEYITREDQVNYLIQNEDHQEIGDMRRTLVHTSPDIEVEQTIQLRLSELVNTGGEEGSLIINKTTNYDQSGQLKSFQIRFELSNKRLQKFLSALIPYEKLAISGETSEDKLKLWFGEKAEASTRELEPTTQMSSSFHPMGGLRPPKPGTTETIRMMDPMRDGTIDVEITTSSNTHELIWQDQNIETHKVSISSNRQKSGGVSGTVWITRSGTILRQRVSHPMIPFDLQFLRITSLPESDRKQSPQNQKTP